MKKRNVFLPLLLLALVFIVFLIRRWNEPQRKEAFDRTPAKVVYTSLILCRMNCRQISKADVEEVMKKGLINFNKSIKMALPCPIFALQALTSGGANIRVMFSQCPAETTVINCYRLNDIKTCYCRGHIKKDSL